MLTELSPSQKELMAEVRQEWLDKIFSPEKRLKLDKEKAKKSIQWLYQLSGLGAPKYIIFVKSPLACQYAANLLRSEVGSKVESEVGSKVESEVGSKVESEVWSKVESEVMSKVESEVWSKVGSEKLKDFTFSHYGSIWDYGWVAYYQFFEKLGIIKNEKFKRLAQLLDAGIYDMIQLKGACIACGMPSEIHRDGIKLHSDKGMAIRWADGYGQYYLYGVPFDETLWKSIVTGMIADKDIFTMPNMEQRMAALKTIGIDKLFDSIDKELLDKSVRGNELYVVKNIFPNFEKAYFLKYECPSTGRVYISGVPPDVGETKEADLAQAWKFSLTPMEYKLLKMEA